MTGALPWQIATVTDITVETPTVKSFTFALPQFLPHLAGQHYDIRLTAADGYQAQRSYSIASEPMRTGEVVLTVERIADGEASTYLHDVVVVGDQVELRGPIGGYFVWEAALGGPLLLVAGGSGVVPLLAMLRHRSGAMSRVPTALVYSARTRDDLIGYDELIAFATADSLPASAHHADPIPAAGLGRLRSPDRRPDALGCAPDGGQRAADVHLRAHAARRDRRRGARWPGDLAGRDQDGTIRPHRWLRRSHERHD